jgi:hypothetical protein
MGEAMQTSDVYVTIGLDQQGNIVEVRANGRVIEPTRGPEGMISEGESTPGGEEVVKRVVHEVLTCRKEVSGSSGAARSSAGAGLYPCCIRDPITGRIWCWC